MSLLGVERGRLLVRGWITVSAAMTFAGPHEEISGSGPTASWQVDREHQESDFLPGLSGRVRSAHTRVEGQLLPRMNRIAYIPTSTVLQELLDEAPADRFTLGWLMGSLHKRSFGIIMLLLALVAMAPGVSMVVGLLLAIPALQMTAGRAGPVFPRRIAARPLPTRHLALVVRRAVPVLRYVEKAIHPRWPTPFEATKRVVGLVVLLLSALLLAPVPMIHVVPAFVVALISLAYLEEDGVLLSIALLTAFILLGVAGVAVWETVLGATWIGRIWQSEF
jgi:hypothetical protein